MDQFVNQNLEDREQTRAAITHKLEALELRLRDSIGNVKATLRRSTDVTYQVRQRPWTMFGISILLGCAVGRLTGGKHADTQRSDTAAKLTKSVEQGIDSVDQMVRKIGTVDYANQLSVIKGATIGAMASLLSELARRAVPTFLAQVEKYSHGKANGRSVGQATDAIEEPRSVHD
jgi:ElaB/YqjD/DUF883 family membrane-anchored ribosome-binding protein